MVELPSINDCERWYAKQWCVVCAFANSDILGSPTHGGDVDRCAPNVLQVDVFRPAHEAVHTNNGAVGKITESNHAFNTFNPDCDVNTGSHKCAQTTCWITTTLHQDSHHAAMQPTPHALMVCYTTMQPATSATRCNS